MLITSFIAGLLGALSPCVYPLIPVTLSVMGVRRYDTHWHGFRVAFSYVLGIVSLHTVLGVAFAYLGILAGSSFQSPWINAILAILLFVMALNLIGVFTWTLPAKATQFLSHVGAQKGHKSAFLMGLVAGVIAIPCTGPILAGILALIAEKRDLVQGSFMMLAYSIGMGLPFLVLGTFSSSISKIPKSGPWMNRLKMLLGAIMVFLAAHYGQLAWNAFRNPSASAEAIATQIQKAQENNKRVILDFWAEWCTLCHELDEKTLKDKRVKKALEGYEVIRVDVTLDSEENRKLQETYGVIGLPTLVFIDSGQQIHGFISPEEMLTELKRPAHLQAP
ncbi:MAG: sulfite exporter TauE/SafE family protein [Deltaproteobacteria bacterium]|nr:sulfite exporter TauE/SafE family protein [Deltaproteobacteria bacterium]